MIRSIWRFVRAFLGFLPLVLAYLRDRNRYILFGRSRRVTSEERRRRAERLRRTLVDLGPTYIKLGQLLSARPDVLPQEYVDELIRLQDDVPPAPYGEVEPIIREDVGDPDEVFDSIEEDAISGASLGQVHEARYRGERVAVKVRRPGVDGLVNADIRAMRAALPVVQRFVEEAHAESLQGLADDFEVRVNQEMDYSRESRMLNEIKGNFRGDGRLVIPATLDSISTRRVLVFRYVEGIKITEVEELRRRGFDTSRIARDLEKIYLKMVMIDGVFHGDPHPGNLAVDSEGRIVMYDFGMSGRVTPSLQESFIELYVAAARRDAEGVVDAMIELGTLSPDVDRDLMVRVIEVTIQDLTGERVDELRVQRLLEEVEDTVYEYPLRIPSYVALGLRVSTIVEGICLQLDPDFDFLGVAREFFVEEGYIQEELRGRTREFVGDLSDTAAAVTRTPVKLERALDRIERGNVEVVAELDDSREHLERLGKRISYAILGGSAAIGGAILATVSLLYAVPVFGFGVLMVVLLFRSFRSPRGVRGPRYYASRYEAEEGTTGGWRSIEIRDGESGVDSDVDGEGEGSGGDG